MSGNTTVIGTYKIICTVENYDYTIFSAVKSILFKDLTAFTNLFFGKCLHKMSMLYSNLTAYFNVASRNVIA